LLIQAPSYRSVKTLLEQRMEAAPLRDDEARPDDASSQLALSAITGPSVRHGRNAHLD